MTDDNQPNALHLTPKDFSEHVLVVIAERTDYQVSVSVPMGDVNAPVCERMGIDEDYGGETAHGSKFTHRTIGLAMRSLRGRGLTKYAKKGHWTCTAAGLVEARKITGVPAPANEVAPAAAPVAARADATTEAVEHEGADIVQLPVVAEPVHPYSDDPYIRSLAVESVVCFGAFSKRSDACKACPISEDCIVHVGVRKAELAAEMEAEEAQAKATAARAEAEKGQKDASVAELIEGFGNENDENANPPQDGDGPKGRFQPANGQDVAPAEAQRETVCIQCNEVIRKGDPVKWASDEGVFHPQCINDPNGN
jgi:hypothetical protein